jgi:Ca2+-binding RTX toxin-like protein
MPTPIKWSAADFELANIQSPEGEPWLSASPDGRFSLAYFETISGPPVRLDAEESIYTASGVEQSAPSATISAATDEHQPAVAWLPNGQRVVVWTEEGRGGAGSEDVYARVYHANGVTDVPRFFVTGSGAGRQHDPVVAANGDGFVIAFNDDSVAGGQLILNFYDLSGVPFASVTGANGAQTVNQLNADQYRDVEITALPDGNYAVVWASGAPFDIWLRIYSAAGAPLTDPIDVSPGASAEFLPDVTALADGRLVVTYEQYSSNTVRGRIFEADGTPSGGLFTIGGNAANTASQQVQTAALQDGRFVTVWRTTAGNIEGRVMFADGTPDGAAFPVNGDAAGDKGRPTVATLADGRFAVSWESGSGPAATIFTTIFEPREAGLRHGATGLSDDWVGTNFADTVFLGAGNDRLSAASGNDTIRGEAGRDTISGDGGADSLHGGNDADTLDGGEGSDRLDGGLGADSLIGGNGNDQYFVDSVSDKAIETNADLETGGNDTVLSQVNYTLGANVEVLRLLSSTGLAGAGNALNNRIIGSNGADFIQGLGGRDTLIGNNGADTLAGGAGNDTLTGGANADVFRFAALNAGADRIEDFVRNGDRFQLSGGSFTSLQIAGADTILTHNGGTIRIVGVNNLNLTQWNALVIPGGESLTGRPAGAFAAVAGSAGLLATTWPAADDIWRHDPDWAFP